IYYTAMALHPAYRWDWFDETWAHKPSWVEKAKEMVADVWLSDYAHLEVRTSSSRGDDEPPAKRPRFFNPFEKNSRLPSSIPPYAAAIVVDEYQAGRRIVRPATATFVIQSVTGSLSKADILGYPGWPWTS
ncbi:Uncharacterized protein HZ326_31140, partial [Fusarium oxysporum f. sp. albedinis]